MKIVAKIKRILRTVHIHSHIHIMRAYNWAHFFEYAKKRYMNELSVAHRVNKHSTHFACVGYNLICGWTRLISAMQSTGCKVHVLRSQDACGDDCWMYICVTRHHISILFMWIQANYPAMNVFLSVSHALRHIRHDVYIHCDTDARDAILSNSSSYNSKPPSSCIITPTRHTLLTIISQKNYVR